MAHLVNQIVYIYWQSLEVDILNLVLDLSFLLNLRVLKFDNVEDRWNNFRKTICEVADCVLGKSAKTATRNI